MPLARSMAKPYKANWPGVRDDFESAALLALVEAAESFDPPRETFDSRHLPGIGSGVRYETCRGVWSRTGGGVTRAMLR